MLKTDSVATCNVNECLIPVLHKLAKYNLYKIMTSVIQHPSQQCFSHVKTRKPWKVLLAGVAGGFSRGFCGFRQTTDWPVSYDLKGMLN